MPETPHEFFANHGFELTFTSHSDEEAAAFYERAMKDLPRRTRKDGRRALAEGRIGSVFANLRGQNGLVLTAYGTGSDERSAAQRAVRRWKQEQGE